MTNHAFELQDGRNLSYALYGPADGQPVLYYHGTPSSRLEPLLLLSYSVNLDSILSENKIRLIAVDRPGIGLSSFHKESTFLSFANDCFQLLKHLKINSAKALGWSGAGPYELAIASKYPDTINSVYIIAGFTRSFNNPNVFKNMFGNKYYFGSAKKVPWLLQLVLNLIASKDPNRPIPQWISRLPDVDHELMKNPIQLKAVFKNTLKEACLKGSKGPVHEAAIYFNDFGFDVSAIRSPVYFWWGSEDKNVTRVHLDYLKEALPLSTIYYKPGEGHLSTYVKYFEEAIKVISR